MPESKTPKFPVRVKIKEYSGIHGDWYWKSLCIVYDNEALGFLLRLLDNDKYEHREEST